MPFGTFVNEIPAPVFLGIHLVAFLVGAYAARRAFAANLGLVGWGFVAYALAELSYMTYHLDWTVFLFAHTVSEVLDLVAVILVFAGAVAKAAELARARA
jgi:membrane-associated protease RseP (regulator of RpoE activity)